MSATLDDLAQNIGQCWRCSHCKWVPTLGEQRFNKICPSIEWGNFHAYSGGGKVINAYALSKQKIPYTDTLLESVFACTMCGACDTACKSNNAELVEPLDILYALRAKIAEDGKSLPAHLAMIESLRTHGNPYGEAAEARFGWADGLELREAGTETVDVLLHVGCDSAFTAQHWPELRAIVGLLRRAGISFGIAGAERSTGEVAFDLGFQKDARDMAGSMASLIERCGVKTVVTCSAGSYAAFRNIWPRLGVSMQNVAVRHVTEFVEDLFERGALKIAGTLNTKVTYHDSCKLGRLSETYTPTESRWTTVLNNWAMHEPPKPILFGNDGLYDAPRKLVARAAGLPTTEMPRNRVASWCCGGAGGAPQAFPDFAAFAARTRIEEAASTGAEVLVTTSCACQRQLEQAAKDAPDGSIRVAGLFALLAEAVAAPQTPVAGS